MKTPDSTDPWEDLFRQRFDDFQAEPPADALERIWAGGNAGKTIPQPLPTNRWRWLGLGLLALLVLMGGSYWLTEKQAIVKRSDTIATQLPGPEVNVATAPTTSAAVDKAKKTSVAAEQPLIQKPQSIEAGEYAESGPITMAKPTQKQEAKQADRPTSDKLVLPEQQKNVSSIQTSELPVTTSTITRKPVQRSRKQPSGIVNQNALAQQQAIYSDRELTKNLVAEEPAILPESPLTSGNQYVDSPVQQATISSRNNSFVTLLAGRKPKALPLQLSMPMVAAPAVTTPQQSRSKPKPSWIASIMPMYTFRQISPNIVDNTYVQQVKTQGAFSTDRIGWRLQAGLEWPLSKQLGLRTSLVYAQLQQTVRYTLRAAKQDSVVINLIDEETVRLTPVFIDQFKTQTNIWHYTGLSADVVWRIGAGQRWHYFATTGASAGAYLGPVKHFTGFYQGSLGMERLLSEHLWLRLEPSLQYGWNAVTDNKELFLIRPYTYGLTIGLRY